MAFCHNEDKNIRKCKQCVRKSRQRRTRPTCEYRAPAKGHARELERGGHGERTHRMICEHSGTVVSQQVGVSVQVAHIPVFMQSSQTLRTGDGGQHARASGRFEAGACRLI